MITPRNPQWPARDSSLLLSIFMYLYVTDAIQSIICLLQYLFTFRTRFPMHNTSSQFLNATLQISLFDICTTISTSVICCRFLFSSLNFPFDIITSLYAFRPPTSAVGRFRRRVRHVAQANLCLQWTITGKGRHTVYSFASTVIHNEGGPKRRSNSSVGFFLAGIVVEKEHLNDLLRYASLLLFKFLSSPSLYSIYAIDPPPQALDENRRP